MDIKVNEDDLKAFARVFAIQQLNEYGMGQMGRYSSSLCTVSGPNTLS